MKNSLLTWAGGGEDEGDEAGQIVCRLVAMRSRNSSAERANSCEVDCGEV